MNTATRIAVQYNEGSRIEKNSTGIVYHPFSTLDTFTFVMCIQIALYYCNCLFNTTIIAVAIVSVLACIRSEMYSGIHVLFTSIIFFEPPCFVVLCCVHDVSCSARENTSSLSFTHTHKHTLCTIYEIAI